MLNADPRYFENTVKLDAISYREAIELSYYGASVIHPKTIKPLQNKDIPLYIKSFYNPEEPGTVIQASTAYDHKVPSYIFKQNQTLVSVRPKDFSFMEEHQIEDVFNALTKASINCNLIQNSALSFSVVFDHHETKLKEFMAFLGEKYNVKYNTDLKLLNVRYYNQETIDSLTKNYEVLNTQQNRINCRMVLKDRQGL